MVPSQFAGQLVTDTKLVLQIQQFDQRCVLRVLGIGEFFWIPGPCQLCPPLGNQGASMAMCVWSRLPARKHELHNSVELPKPAQGTAIPFAADDPEVP